MIKTTFDSTFDLKTAIPRGSRVAILGCSQCASVCRTGDTDRIEEVARALEDHCQVVVATSIDSPCDQRVLRYLAKTVPGFEDATWFVALACEAGARSLAGLLAGPGAPRTVVSPVRTHQFSVLCADGSSKRACLFCDECHRPEKVGLCPVATCPLARTDGPCQDRSSDRCVVDPSSRCAWLPAAPRPDSTRPAPGRTAARQAAAIRFPASVLPAPTTFEDVDLLAQRAVLRSACRPSTSRSAERSGASEPRWFSRRCPPTSPNASASS